MTGVNVRLYTTWNELSAVKDGTSSMLVAYTEPNKPKDATYEITVPLEGCEATAKEVRVNVTTIRRDAAKMAEAMGKAMAEELDKVMKEL
ncbi:hypothetical protein [Paenibacillus sp. 32352]|uniref:hypothetical protein n=1 Tax=Paenibacillus sp. 32352 TaxID=1969111 RepID=UPI0015C4B3FE|nr:hypothetical protein [Paenibacillus sp. 32352]